MQRQGRRATLGGEIQPRIDGPSGPAPRSGPASAQRQLRRLQEAKLDESSLDGGRIDVGDEESEEGLQPLAKLTQPLQIIGQAAGQQLQPVPEGLRIQLGLTLER